VEQRKAWLENQLAVVNQQLQDVEKNWGGVVSTLMSSL